MATIAQKIEPSEATTDKLYTTAVQFEMDANEKDFDKSAKAQKLTVTPAVKVKEMDEVCGGLGPQRQIVRWAFDKETNVGDVKRFEVANMGNVIVKVKKASDKGLMAVEDAKQSVEPILKNKKKAALITAKMKGSTLEAVAQSSGVAIQQAVDLTIDNANIPNAGPERKVVGTAVALGQNKVSAPIEGNSGVYVVKATAITKAPALKMHADYVNKVKSQVQSYTGRVIPALKDNADIEDNRAKFNY